MSKLGYLCVGRQRGKEKKEKKGKHMEQKKKGDRIKTMAKKNPLAKKTKNYIEVKKYDAFNSTTEKRLK